MLAELASGEKSHMAISIVRDADLVVQGPNVLREDLEILQLLTSAAGVEPVLRAQCDAYRLHEPAEVAGVAEACAAAGYDWALVPRERLLSRVRLVAMDMDSTLITIECIDELAALRGHRRRGRRDHGCRDARRDRLSREPPAARCIARRIAGVRACTAFTPSDCRFLRAPNGCSKPAAASARRRCSFPEASRISPTGCRRASHSTIRCRTCWKSRTGSLTGRLQGAIIDADAKAARFAELAELYRGDEGITVAIGDGANDLPMLAAADVSIAYHAKPLVSARAMHAIDYCGLDAVLNLFG